MKGKEIKETISDGSVYTYIYYETWKIIYHSNTQRKIHFDKYSQNILYVPISENDLQQM